jgi:hypothetical protein
MSDFVIATQRLARVSATVSHAIPKGSVYARTREIDHDLWAGMERARELAIMAVVAVEVAGTAAVVIGTALVGMVGVAAGIMVVTAADPAWFKLLHGDHLNFCPLAFGFAGEGNNMTKGELRAAISRGYREMSELTKVKRGGR